MRDPQTSLNTAAAEQETGTPVWAPSADKLETLSAQPGAPCAPLRADKVPDVVGADHSAEGPAAELLAEEDSTNATHLGRPKQFTDFHKAQVCMLIGAGMSQRQASSYLGFHRSIVSKALRRDKKFARDVEKAVATATFNPLYRMIKASERSWRAAAWLLKNAQPHTDLAEREARRAARKAEKEAAEEAIRERDRRRQRQLESDEEFLATCQRVTRDLGESSKQTRNFEMRNGETREPIDPASKQ